VAYFATTPKKTVFTGLCFIEKRLHTVFPLFAAEQQFNFEALRCGSNLRAAAN